MKVSALGGRILGRIFWANITPDTIVGGYPTSRIWGVWAINRLVGYGLGFCTMGGYRADINLRCWLLCLTFCWCWGSSEMYFGCCVLYFLNFWCWILDVYNYWQKDWQMWIRVSSSDVSSPDVSCCEVYYSFVTTVRCAKGMATQMPAVMKWTLRL